MADSTSLPTSDAIPKRKLDARVRNFRDTTMVAGREEAFELSDTAAFVWRLLDDRRSIADIAALLAAEYEVDQQTATQDISELLAMLARAGMVTFRDAD
jgi:hypothetical protein